MNILIGFFIFIFIFWWELLCWEICFVDSGLCCFSGEVGRVGFGFVFSLLFRYTYSVLPFHLNVKISTLDFYYGNSVNIQKKI